MVSRNFRICRMELYNQVLQDAGSAILYVQYQQVAT